MQGASARRLRRLAAALMVELRGVEPLTSSMPWMRSSQLSYSPKVLWPIFYDFSDLRRIVIGNFIVALKILLVRLGSCISRYNHSIPIF